MNDPAAVTRREFLSVSVAAVAKKPFGPPPILLETSDTLKRWLASQTEAELRALESAALESGFGSEFEREVVNQERTAGVPILRSRRIRQEYVRRFMESLPMVVANSSGR